MTFKEEKWMYVSTLTKSAWESTNLGIGPTAWHMFQDFEYLGHQGPITSNPKGQSTKRKSTATKKNRPNPQRRRRMKLAELI